jgi:uncharacterized protein (UPF0147 family)
VRQILMCPKRVKPPHLELKVVVDTNALFTGSSSNFLRKEVADLMSQNSNLPDLTIRWIVPEVVRHERQFQMQQAALQMLPTIEKLERLLGHNLNITKEILEARVKETVDRQVQEHGITVQPLNSTDVDWPRVILDASYRRPPFQLGEKEKGFRDALILETFSQIVQDSPTSRSVARVALVSNDQLLRDAALSRLTSATNVHILESVDALKGLINTIGSSVDEQFIAAIKERAAEIFFKSGDQGTLYYKASVAAKLDQALASAPLKLPSGAYRHRVDKWTISAPRFVKKQGQRIHWATRFEAAVNALKAAEQRVEWLTVGANPALADLTKPYLGASPSNYLIPGQPVASSYLIPAQPQTSPNAYAARFGYGENFQILNPVAEDQVVGYGTASLNVSWSLGVTTSGALTKPELESVDFVDIVWTSAA